MKSNTNMNLILISFLVTTSELSLGVQAAHYLRGGRNVVPVDSNHLETIIFDDSLSDNSSTSSTVSGKSSNKNVTEISPPPPINISSSSLPPITRPRSLKESVGRMFSFVKRKPDSMEPNTKISGNNISDDKYKSCSISDDSDMSCCSGSEVTFESSGSTDLGDHPHAKNDSGIKLVKVVNNGSPNASFYGGDTESTRSRSVSPAPFSSNRLSSISARSLTPPPGRRRSLLCRSQVKESIDLPKIRNAEVYGECEGYDRIFAMALYAKQDEFFCPVADPSFDMIAKMLSISQSTISYNLYNSFIEPYLKSSEFSDFIQRLMKHANLQESEEYSEELIAESSKSMAICCIGKGATLAEDEIYKLGEASQRVIFTPRDIFFYPGMLKLSALFNLVFDPNRANGFYDQFIRTFYSGVYGPRRRDLFYISRIQSIPDKVMPDELLNISIGKVNDESITLKSASENIEMIRETFMDPANRKDLVDYYGKDVLAYKELNPVPKTLEDVLDATESILIAHSFKKMSISTKREIREDVIKNIQSRVNDPRNIDHLQSFYMDIYSPTEAKLLLDEMIFNLGGGSYKNEYRDHAASFLYAAFLKASSERIIPSIAEVNQRLGEMYNLNVSIRKLNIIHKESERVAEIDLLSSGKSDDLIYRASMVVKDVNVDEDN